MVYYTQLKKLWDELALLRKIPTYGALGTCICNVTKRTSELNDEDKLIEFLIGLIKGHNVKSQIWLMDILPSINKAYVMVSRIKKQKEINVEQKVEIDNFSSRFQQRNGYGNRIGNGRFIKKSGRKCTHYGCTNHSRETCFELIGYPDWFPKEIRKNKDQVHATNEFDHEQESYEEEIKSTNSMTTQMHNKNTVSNNFFSPQQLNMLAQEMCKIIKGKAVLQSHLSHRARSSKEDFIAFAGFSGKSLLN